MLAQYNLGTMYVFGQRVATDYAEAVKWFRKAADQGFVGAQHNLGAYRDGQGVAQDFHEALAWFRKAADQGYAEAQFAIALMYSDGQGVP
jgi:TPR repeat protein